MIDAIREIEHTLWRLDLPLGLVENWGTSWALGPAVVVRPNQSSDHIFAIGRPSTLFPRDSEPTATDLFTIPGPWLAYDFQGIPAVSVVFGPECPEEKPGEPLHPQVKVLRANDSGEVIARVGQVSLHLLLESFREQSDVGEGVACPFGPTNGQCCGFGNWLTKFYNVGATVKAHELWKPARWDPPDPVCQTISESE